jgi:hypothetical protein
LRKAGSSVDQESRATADKQLISLSWTSSTVTSLYTQYIITIPHPSAESKFCGRIVVLAKLVHRQHT